MSPAAADPTAAKPADAAESRPEPHDHWVVTEHSITLKGQEISYSVTTGTLILREESEKTGDSAGESEGEQARAAVFFIAYTRTDVDDPASRPVMFSFNGGPGSSSVWLHLGVLGPRRVDLDEQGNLHAPPFKLIDNEHTLLGETDLVFIDPVSTGYSRAVVGGKAKDFHTFKKDIESVGDFIRLYTTRYRRWGSPKFLIGESYGTTRAAGVAGYLQDRHGMFLNGVALVSSVLDFQTLMFMPSNDLPPIVYLPAYAATAWYHKRLDPKLQKDLKSTLAEVEAFALGDYATALLKGSALGEAERKAIAARVARYTGLSAAWVERSHLRIDIMHFTKELMRDEHRTVGRLDSRFLGIDRHGVGAEPDYDPSFTNVMGPYTAMFNEFVRGELKYEIDLPYEILSLKANEAWRFAEHENKFVEVSETLRQAMTVNPFLKVWVGSGYYDLATPYFASEYTFNHIGLDDSLRANITMDTYEAGHMMYLHLPSLAKLSRDLTKFLRAAVPA